MIVLDAATGWLWGGAVLAVVLVGWRLLARRRRGAHWERHAMPASPPPVEATAAARPAPGSAPGSAPAPEADAAARRQETIRAELAAHADRLAAARAARAAAAAQAPVAGAAAGDGTAAQPAGPAVFDPTRTTPWQQVVDSVARARAGLPPQAGGTEALRAAVAAAPAVQPSPALTHAPTRAPTPAALPASPRPASVRPGDFMVRTSVPRVPPLDPNELGARPRRVLVADDARVVRVKLHRLLVAQGWEVIEAEDGDAALRLVRSRAPDLLITDVDMPGLDGFALTRAVRGDAATAQLPVVMITAADDQHRDEAQRAGVTVLLGKPYGEAALLAHLRRLMGLHAVAGDALPA
ncbi:response regulator [Ideonella sp. DXS22W]|uniref:Response regulator n=1 Tax=Pseudaquabacterium inlustre TaxID=2984192 RepID=A0ABU9CL43_9BURK